MNAAVKVVHVDSQKEQLLNGFHMKMTLAGCLRLYSVCS